MRSVLLPLLGALLPSRRWSGALNILAGTVLPRPKHKRADRWKASTLVKLVVDISDGELTTASRQGEKTAASRDKTRQSRTHNRPRHCCGRN